MPAPLETSFNQQRSIKAFDRANRFMPGGVNSPARAFGAVGGKPLFIERAEGPYLYDIDGNRLIDYIGSWGPMILGTHILRSSKPFSRRRTRHQLRCADRSGNRSWLS